ncbi:MAG: hypothetical protein U0414_42240 [Polyangiaceae bacterium]
MPSMDARVEARHDPARGGSVLGMRAHVRFVGVIVAGSFGCRNAPAAQREAPVVGRAETIASASASVAHPGAPASPVPSVVNPPLPAVASAELLPSASADETPEMPETPEQKQWREEYMNAGCKFRRSTNKVASCAAAVPPTTTTWQPSARDVVAVVRNTRSMGGSESGGCYCVVGIAAAVSACAAKVGTGAVQMQIGKEGDATDCTLSVEGFKSSDGRKFVRLNAQNRDQATFYGTLIVHELINGKSDYYVGGFNTIEASLFTLPASDPDADLASARARAEWPTLPADLKTWLAN